MASINKIYGTYRQWKELWDWVEDNNPSLHAHMAPPEFAKSGDTVIISNFMCMEDIYLIMNCPIKFVRDRLVEQYGEEFVAYVLASRTDYENVYNIEHLSNAEARNPGYIKAGK